MFLGTSSPNKKENNVARVRAVTAPITVTLLSPKPRLVSQGESKEEIAGSAKNPVSKVVRVIPS
jgi:hypothetical protein